MTRETAIPLFIRTLEIHIQHPSRRPVVLHFCTNQSVHTKFDNSIERFNNGRRNKISSQLESYLSSKDSICKLVRSKIYSHTQDRYRYTSTYTRSQPT